MSVKRKIDSDDFIKGLKSAFAPIKEAVEPIGKEIKEINDKFTNAVKKELKPVTDKFKTKVAPLIDKAKETYSNVKEYVKSEEGQKNIANKAVEFAKAYREKYKEYFSLEEQIKNVYPDARITFDVEKDENALKNSLGNYKTINVKNEGNEFKVRYYPETGKIRTVVPEEDEGNGKYIPVFIQKQSKVQPEVHLPDVEGSKIPDKVKPELVAPPTLSQTETKTIYPKSYKEKKKDDKWFQKGAFEDGWQWGDLIKTIIGSGTDAAGNVGTSIIGMPEKALDWLVAAEAKEMNRSLDNANRLFGNTKIGTQLGFVDDKTEKLKKDITQSATEFVKKDLYDEAEIAKKIITDPVKNITGIDAETDSVFAEKSDAFFQSAGQLVTTAALQAAGVPWWLTTGVTAAGGEVENALNQGATLEEALASSYITAGAEILTEKLTGGISFGGKTLDDALTKELASRIANKTVRTLVKLGFDMNGEGFEEVLSDALSAVGQKLTYEKEKNFNELFSSEEAFDSYIGGVVLGGGSSSIKAIKSNKVDINETAFIDGLWGREESQDNANEENVESSQLESVENFDESGIINHSQKQQEFFDINLLPEQMHHFATNKNKKYTPKFNDIVSKYGLNLDDPWNKGMMKHRGKHPYIYHDYILYKMRKCDITAEGDVEIFKKEFEIVKKKIIDNPYILRKAFWKGKDNEILFDDV